VSSTEQTRPQEASATAAAFHAAYRVLALLFLPPEQDRLATVVLAIPELRSIVWPLSNLPCDGHLDELLTGLEALDDAGVERLGTDHAAMFLSGSRDHAVQPYESWHVRAGDYERASVSAALSARYRTAGLAVGLPGELPDHVAIELEFCAYLCHEEGDAADDAAARRWRRERRAFLVEHPLRWLGSFERAVWGSIPESPYVGFARTARQVASDDRMLLDVLLAEEPGRDR
jgi:TorA maturation chaperone TorD